MYKSDTTGRTKRKGLQNALPFEFPIPSIIPHIPILHNLSSRSAAHHHNEQRYLKPVFFDIVPLGNLLLLQPFRNFVALVACELEHFAELFIIDNGAVAREFLLESAQHFIQVELLRNALDGRQGLAAIALLYADICRKVRAKAGVKDNKKVENDRKCFGYVDG
ncbi:hypothetical protein BC937DRAFT_94429 [Endogone sp. FLAS-F59071]|nr:hypothetical protein BC937DRAFT_94429 [Endogone sp. FLAS-F59071]|eukprot:RUS14044.1 hypothetical protein BC937DRAFT_94429 [Endogone sp. FLAS-F59071]